DVAVRRLDVVPAGRAERGDRASARAPVTPAAVAAALLLLDRQVPHRGLVLRDPQQRVVREHVAQGLLYFHVALRDPAVLVYHHVVLADAAGVLPRLHQLTAVEHRPEDAP